MKRAEEEDVMVYAIGLAGSRTAPPSAATVRGGYGGGAASADSGAEEGRGGSRRLWRRPTVSRQAGRRAVQDRGGDRRRLLRAHVDERSRLHVRRVADELHHQYALGFTPTELDGKMHELEVRLADASEIARARKSYLAQNER